MPRAENDDFSYVSSFRNNAVAKKNSDNNVRRLLVTCYVCNCTFVSRVRENCIFCAYLLNVFTMLLEFPLRGKKIGRSLV